MAMEYILYVEHLGRVTISSILVVEPNSFSGTKTITQKHDDATCATTFGPSMVFNIPLRFTITYTGDRSFRYKSRNC